MHSRSSHMTSAMPTPTSQMSFYDWLLKSQPTRDVAPNERNDGIGGNPLNAGKDVVGNGPLVEDDTNEENEESNVGLRSSGTGSALEGVEFTASTRGCGTDDGEKGAI